MQMSTGSWLGKICLLLSTKFLLKDHHMDKGYLYLLFSVCHMDRLIFHGVVLVRIHGDCWSIPCAAFLPWKEHLHNWSFNAL